MRDETAAWLEPMALEASVRNLSIAPLMRQASMPAQEADNGFLDGLAASQPAAALDWIRFGQLLRETLGWLDYPTEPKAAR